MLCKGCGNILPDVTIIGEGYIIIILTQTHVKYLFKVWCSNLIFSLLLVRCTHSKKVKLYNNSQNITIFSNISPLKEYRLEYNKFFTKDILRSREYCNIPSSGSFSRNEYNNKNTRVGFLSTQITWVKLYHLSAKCKVAWRWWVRIEGYLGSQNTDKGVFIFILY